MPEMPPNLWLRTGNRHPVIVAHAKWPSQITSDATPEKRCNMPPSPASASIACGTSQVHRPHYGEDHDGLDLVIASQ